MTQRLLNKCKETWDGTDTKIYHVTVTYDAYVLAEDWRGAIKASEFGNALEYFNCDKTAKCMGDYENLTVKEMTNVKSKSRKLHNEFINSIKNTLEGTIAINE